jgi:hypothetical protein
MRAFCFAVIQYIHQNLIHKISPSQGGLGAILAYYI